MKKLKEKLNAAVIGACLSGAALLILVAQMLAPKPAVDTKLGTGLELYKVASSTGMVVGTSGRLITASSSRGYAAIVNEGTNVVYLQFGDKPPVAYEGLRLNANGGTFEITDENLYRGAIRAITVSGNSTTTFFEAL